MNLNEWMWQISCTIYNNLPKKWPAKVFKNIEWTWYSSPFGLQYLCKKKVLDEFYSEEEEEQPTRKRKKQQQQQKQPWGRSETKEKVQRQKSMRAKRRQTKTRLEKTGLSVNDAKKLDNLYLKGPASFGNAKRLQNLGNLSIKKVKMYLEKRPSFTKYRLRRLRFPRFKVIVNDLNEIWSVDLAFVDKLAKYNRGVK